jgi:hypothetical protein
MRSTGASIDSALRFVRGGLHLPAMRAFLAGLIILILSSSAWGQASGEVETIGFQNHYRPDAWTPMIVRLTPETGVTSFYKLQVRQEDGDFDRVLYERTISLTGNEEGRPARQQRFFMYFIPKSTRSAGSPPGLPDSKDPGSLRELQSQLKVFLCENKPDGKQLAQITVTSSITNVEPPRGFRDGRSTKFILVVRDPDKGSQAHFREYADAVGISEDIVMVPVRVDELPDLAIGLQGVDAILWLNADPVPPNIGDEKVPVLRDYVRSGGRLVICQMPDWQKSIAFGDLLPVTFPRWDGGVQGMVPRPNIDGPLREWTRPERDDARDPWGRIRGPIPMAAAQAKPGAIVDAWLDWPEGSGVPEKTPYLVRQVYGLGSVTWVAHDLGAPELAGQVTTGWYRVWDQVFDWAHDTRIFTGNPERDRPLELLYGSSAPLITDFLGTSMEHTRTGAFLIGVAAVFFVVYWLAAGPGTYLFLVSKKKSSASWFAFAVAAIVATALTILVVRLVLRGPPQAKHFSIVKFAPNQPVNIDTYLGLYIPRDGYQSVRLTDTAPGHISYVIPYANHPRLVGPSQESFPAYMEYSVPVPESQSDVMPAIEVPYRSTSKKLQARWVGETRQQIEGADLKLMGAQNGYLEGLLINATGHDLQHVYLAFRMPNSRGENEDWILYRPDWKNGERLDLRQEFTRPAFLRHPDRTPEGEAKVIGRISQGAREWREYWFRDLRHNANRFHDRDRRIPRDLPVLSFYDRILPMRRPAAGDRIDILRYGARGLDVSDALSAGALVVLAESHGPVPAPIFYQAVFPLDRTPFLEFEPQSQLAEQREEEKAREKQDSSDTQPAQ